MYKEENKVYKLPPEFIMAIDRGIRTAKKRIEIREIRVSYTEYNEPHAYGIRVLITGNSLICEEGKEALKFRGYDAGSFSFTLGKYERWIRTDKGNIRTSDKRFVAYAYNIALYITDKCPDISVTTSLRRPWR